jgi:hypothetical protein
VTISRRSFVLLVVLILVGATLAQTAKISSVLELPEFVRDWQISKQFTIDVANAMPAELYDFRPNPEEMTFGEQMLHIAVSNVFRDQASVPARSCEAARIRQADRVKGARSIVRLRDRCAAKNHARATSAHLAHSFVEGPKRP